MKLLTENELIEVLPAEETLLKEALRNFDDVLPSDLRERGVCLRAALEGQVQASTISVNGQVAHVILHHTTFDGGLFIDVAQTVRPLGNLADIFAAVEALARSQGNKYILFATVRRGLAQAAQQLGYSVQSVNLVKGLHATKG